MMSWSQVEELPHRSVTRYVRVMDWLPGESVELTVTSPPQFSDIVPPWAMKPAEFVACAGAAPFGTVTVGVRVMMKILGQLRLFVASIEVTVTAPPQF